MAPPERLYTTMGGDQAWASPDVAALDQTHWIDPGGLPCRVELEEWTAAPPQRHLPNATQLLERVQEDAHECGELTIEDAYFDPRDPVLLAAAQGFIDTLAATITWRQCDEHVADVVVEVQRDRTCVVVSRTERRAP